MSRAIWVLVSMLIVGCVPTFDDPNAVVLPPEKTMAMARANLSKLTVGMPRDEVMQLMTTKTHYYRRLHHHETIIPHPYTTGTVVKDGKTWEVLYYLTEHKKGNDALTPVVLQNDRVIGWGWTFLGDKTQRIQVNID